MTQFDIRNDKGRYDQITTLAIWKTARLFPLYPRGTGKIMGEYALEIKRDSCRRRRRHSNQSRGCKERPENRNIESLRKPVAATCVSFNAINLDGTDGLRTITVEWGILSKEKIQQIACSSFLNSLKIESEFTVISKQLAIEWSNLPEEVRNSYPAGGMNAASQDLNNDLIVKQEENHRRMRRKLWNNMKNGVPFTLLTTRYGL